MNHPKKHHFVPQCYLRQFSSDKKIVNTLNTQTKERCIERIDDICQIENLYYLSQSNNHYSIETDFFNCRVENKLGTLLNFFNSLNIQDKCIPFNMDLRKSVSKQIVLQYLRTPKFRNTKAESELNAYFSQIEYLLNVICDFQTEEISYTFEGSEYHKNILLDDNEVKETSNELSTYNWELLRTEDREFCTSDHPIAIIERQDMPVTYCDAIKYFKELFYPITPSLLLHIENKELISSKSINQRIINNEEFIQINNLIKDNAIEIIIYKENLY